MHAPRMERVAKGRFRLTQDSCGVTQGRYGVTKGRYGRSKGRNGTVNGRYRVIPRVDMGRSMVGMG